MFYLILFLKLTLGFIVVIAHLNYSGKTQLSQMTTIDFIGNFILGGIIGGIIYNDGITFVQYISVLLLGVALISFFNYLTQKFDLVQRITVGDPITIIKNRQFILENIKKNKLDILAISSAVHAQGVQSFEKIAYAQIEPNGQLTITLDSKDIPSKIVVSDGCIKSAALTELKKDEDWLMNLIKKLHLEIEEVFLFEYTDHGILVVDHHGVTHRLSV